MLFLLLLSGCSQQPSPLPVLGTFTHKYELTDQAGRKVTPEVFAGNILVTDFFFTTCPTICPIMKSQMLRVYEAFENTPEVLLLSHTIDPEHDTVEVLGEFGRRLGIDPDKWRLVTGPKDVIYPLAKQYMLGVAENKQAPGGYIHSGSFCLLDSRQRIRGYYDGTDTEEVNRLIRDIKGLLNEKQAEN